MTENTSPQLWLPGMIHGRTLARRRRAVAAAVATGMLVAMVPMAAIAAPTVGNSTGEPATYTEQHAPTLIGEDVVISDAGSSYGGGFIDFEVSAAEASDFLSLRSVKAVDDADTSAGAVSIVGASVYLGDGVGVDIIGSIDPDFDGQQGRALRVNFTSPFTNPSFEALDLGWTPMNQQIDLGVTEIADFVPEDTSNYGIETEAGDPAPTDDANAPDPTSQYGPTQWITQIDTTDWSDGQQSLRLESSMGTSQMCDIVHGPAVYSKLFEAAAGDTIFFDWKASGSGDHSHVFGYIINEQGEYQTEVLDATTPDGTSSWYTTATAIPADGDYRFVFVAGTFDYTCGTKAGASLLIDNVRVYGSKVNQSVVQDIVRKLEYKNDSDTPATERTVNLTVVDTSEDGSGNGTGTGAIEIDITPVDDLPTLAAVAPVSFTNGADPTETFGTAPGTSGKLAGADVDNTITYGITGGTANTATIDGVAYTHSLAGKYGTLRLNEDTGDYRFVPDNAAVNARLTSDVNNESFSFTATGGTETVTQKFTVDVTVTAAAPSAPAITKAEPAPEQVELAWTAPSWLGGAAITGYKIEQSTDSGASWTTVAEDTEKTETSYLVTELTNGVETSFRVSAINSNGVSAASAVEKATPVDVPSAPVTVKAVPANGQVALSWGEPMDDGGSAVTGYRIEKSINGGAMSIVAGNHTETSYTVTGMKNGEAVAFRIVAINAVGDSAPSGTVLTSARTTAKPVTDLAATPGNAQVALDWTEPADDGGATITGYLIEQYVEASETWSMVTSTTNPRTSYTVPDLPNGVEVTFRVSPINAAGTGPVSKKAAATPRTVADPVTDLAATPGDEQVTLDWTAPAEDGGAPVTGYLIEQSLDAGTTWTTIVADTGTPGTSFTVQDLPNGKQATFRVSPINAAGTGTVSNEAAATPRTMADPVTALAATPGNTLVDLVWTASADDGGAPVTGYLIEQYDEASETWTMVTSTTNPRTLYTARDLANGVEVIFRVSPINAAGTGTVSNEAAATPRTVPSAPGTPTVTSTNRTLTVTFPAPAFDGGAAITEYEYSLDGGATWTATGATNTSLVIGALVNSQSYPLMIRAVNAAGPGTPSVVFEAIPALEPVRGPGDALTETPSVPPGTSELLIDGVRQPADVSIENGTWTVTGDGFTVSLEATDPDGGKLAVDAQGRLVVTDGGSVRISGTGFRADSLVDVWLFSTPYLLGEVLVEADGTFAGAFELPAGIDIGPHTVQLNGVSDDGELRSLSTGLVVLGAAVELPLATTGIDAGQLALQAILLLTAGTVAAVAGRSDSKPRPK